MISRQLFAFFLFIVVEAQAFSSCVPARMSIILRNNKLLSTINNDFVNEMIFSEEIPLHYRKAILSLQQDIEKERKALKEKEVEIERALKEVEKALKEKEIERAEKTEVVNILSRMNQENTMLAPRAIIEYVESFVMPAYKIVGNSRKEKWKVFFTNSTIGANIYNCILESNPLWKKTPTDIAERMHNMYQYSSDYHHQSSLQIQETKELNLQAKLLLQSYNVILCIAKHCEITLFDLNDNNN